jgi:hypothetical protein
MDLTEKEKYRKEKEKGRCVLAAACFIDN